jgi:hypothetical protein
VSRLKSALEVWITKERRGAEAHKSKAKNEKLRGKGENPEARCESRNRNTKDNEKER